MRSWFFIGVDLGMERDFSAISIVERREAAGAYDAAVCAYRKKVEMLVRHLERVPLGTPYPEVAERVAGLTEERELAGRCTLVVDATGVGTPVVEMIRRARPAATLMPVRITGGEEESKGGETYRVPKRDLMLELVVMLEGKELWFAGGMEQGPALLEELMAVRSSITASGRERFGATRRGQHDDLVVATALACWAVRRSYPSAAGGEGGYCGAEQRRIV